MALSLIKQVRKCRNGGACAICDSGYIATKGWKYLLQNEKGIVEPYTLCEDCKETVEMQGVIEE